MSTQAAAATSRNTIINRTPERDGMQRDAQQRNASTSSQASASSTASPNAYSGSGGAATQRRMRSQMRKTGSQQSPFRHSESEPMSSSGSVASPPPQSPHSMKHYLSSDSVGSSQQRGKATDHVSNYSMSHATQNRQQLASGGNRSVGSATRSITSSNSSEQNLFQDGNGIGFTFDAFGLDPTQIHQEESQAMHDIVDNGLPDLSFYRP